MNTKLTKEELKSRAKLVAENMNGLQHMHLPFYTLSIAYPVCQGMAAFRRYEASKIMDVDSEFLFSAAQEGINHAAAISRFLWPSGNSKIGKEGALLHKARGQTLREKLNVLDDSPLNDRGCAMHLSILTNG